MGIGVRVEEIREDGGRDGFPHGISFPLGSLSGQISASIIRISPSPYLTRGLGTFQAEITGPVAVLFEGELLLGLGGEPVPGP